MSDAAMMTGVALFCFDQVLIHSIFIQYWLKQTPSTFHFDGLLFI